MFMGAYLNTKLVKLAFKMRVAKQRTYHVSYIVRRNKIYSVGINDRTTTHPMAKQFGWWNDNLHSEVDAYRRYCIDYPLSECDLYNVRLDNMNRIRISRPCKACLNLLDLVGFRRVYFTDDSGDFIRLFSAQDKRFYGRHWDLQHAK